MIKRVFVKAVVGEHTTGVQAVYLSTQKMTEMRARGYEMMNPYALYRAEAALDESGAPAAGTIRFAVDATDTWVLFGERPEDVG